MICAGLPIDISTNAALAGALDKPNPQIADVMKPKQGMGMKLDRRSVVCALPLGILAGCAKPPPPPPPPRKLPIEVVAAPDINPDLRDRASPLTLRVLGLKAQAAFTSADFFSLFDKETATLGADLLLREEMVLRPGESRRFVWTLPGDFRFVGVVAALVYGVLSFVAFAVIIDFAR